MNAVNIKPILPFPKIHVNFIGVLGVMLIVALLSFELFNYSTTEYALGDLLGNLNFWGVNWSTILTIAFCGIDFAGISRLFVVGKGQGDVSESWYLFGAWMLSATMNAILTWWGVSMAVLNHPIQSANILDAATLTRVVPIFVALMVWIIRIMAIGTVATAGRDIFRSSKSANEYRRNRPTQTSETRTSFNEMNRRPLIQPMAPRMASAARNPQTLSRREVIERDLARETEPTYRKISM